MSVRSFAQALVFCGALLIGVTAAQAGVIWNAYDGFISGPTSQATSNTWQYLYNDTGDNNSGYTLLERWGDNGDGIAIDGWTSTNPTDTWHNEVVLKDADSGEILLHPFKEPTTGTPDYTATIGWLSPMTGKVNVDFSVTDRNGGGGDGVEYWLYKSGVAADSYLYKGAVDNGEDWTSGPISIDDISVDLGDMLYLRVGARDTYNYDLTGVNFVVTQAKSDISGDANNDGKVDGSDVTILAGNWQAGVGNPNTETVTWEMGDFNGDGQIDGSDVTILAGNWQYGVEATATAVPEPSTLGLLLTVLVYWCITLRRNKFLF